MGSSFYVGFMYTLVVVGYVANIVQLATEYTEVGIGIVKGVGIIVPPIGAIMGLVGLFT